MKEILTKKLEYTVKNYNKYTRQYMKDSKKSSRDLALYYSTRMDTLEEIIKLIPNE